MSNTKISDATKTTPLATDMIPLARVGSSAALSTRFQNISVVGTITTGTWRGTTIATSYGGTGVTTSSGANSVVLRDESANISTNAAFTGFTNIAAGASIILTTSSTPNYVVTGSGGQTFQLPSALTLPVGAAFTFNNNQSSGAIAVNNNSATLVVSVPSGGYVTVTLLTKSFAAGTWDVHYSAPANVIWSTNTFNVPASITGATWNSTAVGLLYGGTGATTAAGARTNLGLGSMATQAAGAVAIDGGTATLTSITTTQAMADTAYQTYSPSTGFVIAANNYASWVVLSGSGTLASGQVQLPVSATDGQRTTISTTALTVTALTVVGGSGAGQTVFGAPGTISPTTPVSLRYISSSKYWIRC